MWLPVSFHGAPRHLPRGSHIISCHVSYHVICHILVHVSNQLISTSDVASQSKTINFVIDFGLWAGFTGLYTNL
jgi:hypothetical protein